MKTNYKKILALTISTILLLSLAFPCTAAEGRKERFADESGRRHRRFEPTEEMIDKLMERIKDDNPKRAEELKKLRKENPKQFEEIIRSEFAKMHGARKPTEEHRGFAGRHDDMRTGKSGGYGGGRGGGGVRGGPEPQMHQRADEVLEWLEKNYPEKAEELRELREKDHELFRRRMVIAVRRYGLIADKAKENPKFAELFKEGVELKRQKKELRTKIKKTTDEDQKKELIIQLESVLSRRFDLLVKWKQLEYEQLLKKLEDLKKDVEKSKARVEKWKNPEFKKERIKERLDELVSGKEKFKWE